MTVTRESITDQQFQNLLDVVRGYAWAYSQDTEGWTGSEIVEDFDIWAPEAVAICDELGISYRDEDNDEEDDEVHPAKQVVVEVLGGVAEVTACPPDVKVRIIDHD